jgi:hypothetical protein
MAVATITAPSIRRERAAEPVAERTTQRPSEPDAPPKPLAAARGIALAIGLGALAWALVIAVLLRL